MMNGFGFGQFVFEYIIDHDGDSVCDVLDMATRLLYPGDTDDERRQRRLTGTDRPRRLMSFRNDPTLVHTALKFLTAAAPSTERKRIVAGESDPKRLQQAVKTQSIIGTIVSKYISII